MKRFISILISVVMILTLGMAVMAADPTYPVTVTKANSSDKYIHDLELYQIFDAKVHEDSGNLYDASWGSGVTGGGASLIRMYAVLVLAICPL